VAEGRWELIAASRVRPSSMSRHKWCIDLWWFVVDNRMLIGLNCWWRPTSSKRLRPCHASKWDFGVSTGALRTSQIRRDTQLQQLTTKPAFSTLRRPSQYVVAERQPLRQGTFRDAEAPLHGVSDYRVNNMWLFRWWYGPKGRAVHINSYLSRWLLFQETEDRASICSHDE